MISQTSIEIQRRLDEFNLDVGVTYLDNESSPGSAPCQLYRERYVLLTRPERSLRGRSAISWSEVASLPLCLLTPDMQNRRILDMHFREAGAEMRASLETNSLLTLLCHLRFGHWSSVVPHTLPPARRDRRLDGDPAGRARGIAPDRPGRVRP